ncbi:hypothetical protein PHYSODRAFT_534295 [Phytophthora sojae]|uniref:Uncharacterized protein n=1 Tax=Phytophthora sojae (strain P6497) TaxID=1094619 RepID=G4YMG9_PHYSP|nr:hypothetical protein PHYSODRAFT_475603 [Phytophthora sojae]XP_009531746.1 hypothetical protein PHYSODRAFT_513836 [Phytophthora sojae]XP_009539253.1 hypothetical protein PHYSODRAFT_534295 [Phytophthora sojae]EGZ05332.1 hypothetical protein PHYSODRAFT_534295 [Phytophthora sojae]EGZ14317.1 hypothetical protein PHYSODRAFT_513836 [Phytophthora sojae]EGZ28595.1 hypothetical protein PHYSODRAFT_475603 [Phytophthora sojae]|eukprot:XP_009515870.1 hypothetical protein PHYSODRAFT_475603 [Phytophthora sojae]
MTYSPEQYQANKERIKAAQKRYYLKTRETRIAKQKEYDERNREHIRAQKRKSYAAKKQCEPNSETELS